jgi:hypothetical protein
VVFEGIFWPHTTVDADTPQTRSRLFKYLFIFKSIE